MMIFKKRQIVTVTLVALLVVAGYLNFVYLGESPQEDGQMVSGIGHEAENEDNINYGEAKFVTNMDGAKNDYFNETKLSKEKTRSESVALLKQVTDNPSASAEEKKQAQQKMIQTAQNIEKEGPVENILKGKGFANVSAYISEDSITVAVLTEGLNPTDVAKIRDVVISETKLKADKIKIMEIK